MSQPWLRVASAVFVAVLTPSLAAQRTLEATKGPAAPTNVAAAAGRFGVTVTWTGVQAEAVYRVLRSSDVARPGVDLTSPIVATSFVDRTAEPGTPYFYQVIAVYPDRSQGAAPAVFYTPAEKTGQAIAAGAPFVTAGSFISANQAFTLLPSAPQQATAVLPGWPVKGLQARAGSGGGVYVTWEKAAGASYYEGERWRQASPDCCRALVKDPNIPDQGSAYTDVPANLFARWSDWPPTGGVFVYRVTVVYADGSRGSADVTYTQPGPTNPEHLTASFSTYPDLWLRLHWSPVNGAAYYVLWGPGLPSNGVQLDVTWAYTLGYLGTKNWYAIHPKNYAFPISNVAPGVHSWGIKAYFLPGPQSTPAADYTQISLNVEPAP